nr:hypothetical protein GCM10020185_73820 [Pseudomonas brassicacearum subsp. brassicacearum]
MRPGILTRTTFLLAVLSGVAIVGNWVLLFASYSRASIAIGTAVYNVQPFMLVGLAALFLGEKNHRAETVLAGGVVSRDAGHRQCPW